MMDTYDKAWDLFLKFFDDIRWWENRFHRIDDTWEARREIYRLMSCAGLWLHP